MSEQGMMLVNAFRWGALAVGVPSLAGSIGFGILSLVMWINRPDPVRDANVKVSDSLVNVLVIGAGWVAKVLGGIIGLFEGLIWIATVASLCGLALAGLMWMTSRGLAANALWARGSAGTIMLLFLLIGFIAGVTSGTSGVIRLCGLALMIGSGYSLSLIWRGFV